MRALIVLIKVERKQVEEALKLIDFTRNSPDNTKLDITRYLFKSNL